jgi:hypothetical protein
MTNLPLAFPSGCAHPRQIDAQDGFFFATPGFPARAPVGGNERDDAGDVRRFLDGLRIDKLRNVRHAPRLQRDESADGPGGPTQEATPPAHDFDPIIGDPACPALRETQRTGGLAAAAVAGQQEPPAADLDESPLINDRPFEALPDEAGETTLQKMRIEAGGRRDHPVSLDEHLQIRRDFSGLRTEDEADGILPEDREGGPRSPRRPGYQAPQIPAREDDQTRDSPLWPVRIETEDPEGLVRGRRHENAAESAGTGNTYDSQTLRAVNQERLRRHAATDHRPSADRQQRSSLSAMIR